MLIRDLAKLSTRMFKARTSRTLLTILGMGIGISAILFLVALGYGIQNTLLETITTADSLLTLDVFPGKDTPDNKISQEYVEKIKGLENVALISPIFQSKAQVKFNDLISDASTLVVDDRYLSLSGTKITDGSVLNSKEPDGIVVSSTFSKVFNIEPVDMLGKEINFSLLIPEEKNSKKTRTLILDKPFKIVGITDNKEVVMLVNSLALTENLPVKSFSSLKVKCSNSASMGNIREKLVEMSLSVSALSDVVKETEKVFKVIRIILAFFGIVALIVSAIGMFNTMTVTLLERTEEIGIMKSIGAYDGNILSMFVFESTLMGFLGGISGVIIGIISAKLFNILINFVASKLGGSPVSLFYFPLWFIAFIILSGTVVGFITGLIPAKKASSIDPLDALRYK